MRISTQYNGHVYMYVIQKKQTTHKLVLFSDVVAAVLVVAAAVAVATGCISVSWFLESVQFHK